MAFIFVLMCCIVASRGLSNTSNKQLAVSTLMLPVSEKERYIARYVIYVPVYTLALFGGMFLVECLRFSILKIIYPHSPFLHFLGLSFFTPDIFPWIDFALFFIGVQSFFFLSGAVWPRLGMVYAVVYFVAFNVLNGILASVILTNCNYDYLPFRHDFEWSQREENIFSLVLSLTFCVVSCGINYVLAYFRCKEREIINRW